MRTIKREELERKRNALSSEIHSSMNSTRDADHRRDMFKDPYGSASMTHDDEVAALMVERRARELNEVDRALADMDAGRYGVCRECGGPIGEGRLKVLPFATRCVRCQSQLETERPAA